MLLSTPIESRKASFCYSLILLLYLSWIVSSNNNPLNMPSYLVLLPTTSNLTHIDVELPIKPEDV